MAHAIFIQFLLSVSFYMSVVIMMRLAGKRLAGQTTTFDLIILITLSVTLQALFVEENKLSRVVFVVTVFMSHIALSRLSSKYKSVRRLVRGTPTTLVKNGKVMHDALKEEAISYDELVAGLRKLGMKSPEEVKIACLEETGHISAVPLKA